MFRMPQLLSICLAALLFHAISEQRAFGGQTFEEPLIGTVYGSQCPTLDELARLTVVSSEEVRIVNLLPYIEQENLYRIADGNHLGFASDGIGLHLNVFADKSGSIEMSGFLDGPRAPKRPSVAFLRPFAEPGGDVPAGQHPGMMNLGSEEPQFVSLEVVDTLPGLFTARLVDESGKGINLVGTTAADGRFLATGVGDGTTVHIAGELTTDSMGQRLLLDATITIEDRFGRPTANGIIAILIG